LIESTIEFVRKIEELLGVVSFHTTFLLI